MFKLKNHKDKKMTVAKNITFLRWMLVFIYFSITLLLPFPAVSENYQPVREQNDPSVYMLRGNIRYWIVNGETRDYMGFSDGDVKIVPSGSLSNFQNGTPLLKPRLFIRFSDDGKVFMQMSDNIYQPQLRWVTGREFENRGNPWNKVTVIHPSWRSFFRDVTQ